jgi:pimeloyl-ACP methyl ester carboxylesterase
LLDADWDLFLLDQRGHGESEKTGGYRVLDYIGDALEVADAIGTDDLFLYGHSLGAMVAAAVAAERAVCAAVLEDPPFETMGDRMKGSAWQALFEGMRRFALRGGGVVGILEGIGSIQIPQREGGARPLSSLRDRSALCWSAECLEKIDPAVLDPLVEGRWLHGWDWKGVFHRARASVRVLQGDVHAGAALEDADLQAAGESGYGFEKVFFPGSGHQLHWSDAGRVAAVVNGLRNSGA